MSEVPGLLYLPGYIDPTEHERLVQTIDSQPWRTALSRRTQHYGYVYDYRAKNVDRSMWLGELPAWLARIALRLQAEALMPETPDQAIINEYLPGQGIADHVDCTPCFGDAIASLSLGSPVVMDLKRDGRVAPVVLEPGSLLVLRGEARYRWTHGIARRKHDTVGGLSIARGRRLSVTFRRVVESNTT